MGKVLDITGQTFGYWTVATLSHKKNNKVYWICKCICGNEKTLLSWDVRKRSKSCGCKSREMQAESREDFHGKSRTPVYNTWSAMMARCHNPNYTEYHLYGGRGIKVCKEWRNSFKSFYDDMGDRPYLGHSLERIDVNKGYCKNNCRWATRTEQARNKRKNVNNKSGFTGVHKGYRDGKLDRYRAEWIDLEGKTKSKSFSINKYGKEEAFRLACEARENAIKELNEQGAGYSENHGK